MQSLSQSPFLQALGYAIAHSLWQVALLWILVVMINSLLKLSAHVRYKVALTAQLAGFAWFIVTLQFYYSACSKALDVAKELAINNSIVFQPQAETFHSRLLNYLVIGERVLPYLSIAYIGLLIFLTIKWIRSYKYTRIIKTEGLQKIEVEWRLFVKRMMQHLEIRNEISIYLSELVKSPLTIGFLKPIILIPIASINHLTTEQLEAVILHELAHIKRADYLINIVQSLIEIALFFNPFTQLISKQIRKERENCCDDWVLQFQYNPSMYAEALLQIAYLQTDSAFAMQASGHDKGDLLLRVKRLLNKKEKVFNYRQQLVALVLMTGIFCSIAWFQPDSARVISKKSAPLKTVIVEPLAAQVDNPLFNPVFFLSKPLKEEVNKATQQAQQQIEAKTQVKLKEAQEALTKITPAVIDRINDVKDQFTQDFTDNLQKAQQEAKKQIAQIDWSNLSQNAPSVDTAALALTLKQALDQKNFNFDWHKINESLTKVQLDLKKMQANKQLALLGQNVMQDVVNKTFSALNQSFAHLQDKQNSEDKQNKNLWRNELEKKQNKMMQKMQLQRLQQQEQQEKLKVDSIRQYLTLDRKRIKEYYEDGNAPVYTFSHPVYVETPVAPAALTSYTYYTGNTSNNEDCTNDERDNRNIVTVPFGSNAKNLIVAKMFEKTDGNKVIRITACDGRTVRTINIIIKASSQPNKQ